IEDIYELSPLQYGMLFHSLYTPGTGVYLEQILYHFPTTLNVYALQAAVQTLALAHPILRTSFFLEDVTKPLQVVHRHVQVPVEHHDWRRTSLDERCRLLEEYVRMDSERGFNISEPPLLRMSSFLSQDGTDFLLSFHHALFDGWSLQLLMKDLASL